LKTHLGEDNGLISQLDPQSGQSLLLQGDVGALIWSKHGPP